MKKAENIKYVICLGKVKTLTSDFGVYRYSKEIGLSLQLKR